MQVWQYSDSAFSGQGGLHSDGRWHHKGNLIVYTSQSLSLATLEAWMHVAPESLLPNYIAVTADIPEDLRVHLVNEKDLAPGWNSIRPAPTFVRDGTCGSPRCPSLC